MTPCAAVCIDDNLTPGKAGIAHRPAEDETSGGVNMVSYIFLIKKLSRQNRLDNLLDNVFF